jgi:hypothetical protein
MKRKQSTGYTLTDDLTAIDAAYDAAVDELRDKVSARRDAVSQRLAELEAEDVALGLLKSRIGA